MNYSLKNNMSNTFSNFYPFNYSSSKIKNNKDKLSISMKKDNNINIKSPEELKIIFSSILEESSKSTELKFTTNDLLSIYIRRNRNKINETLNEISQFFSTNKINPELLIQCLDAIFNSLMENNHIIN